MTDSNSTRTLHGTTAALSGPHGFTLSITGGFVLAVRHYHVPSLLQAWLFGAGGVVAFGSIAALSGVHQICRESLPSGVVVPNPIALFAPLAGCVVYVVTSPTLGFCLDGVLVVSVYVLGLAAWNSIWTRLVARTRANQGAQTVSRPKEL
jgi:hypothetical protein